MAIIYNPQTGQYEDDQSGSDTPNIPTADNTPQWDGADGLRRILEAYRAAGETPSDRDLMAWGSNPSKEQYDQAITDLEIAAGSPKTGVTPPTGTTGTPGTTTGTTGTTGTTTGGQTPFSGGMSEFQDLFGSPRTPAELVALEARLNAAGITIARNAAGVAGKIRLPNGQIIDVINSADAGGKGFQWLTGSGGADNTTVDNPIDQSYLDPWTGKFEPGSDTIAPKVPETKPFSYADYQKPGDFSYADYQKPADFAYADYKAPDPFSYEAYDAPDPFSYEAFQAPGAFEAPTGESIQQDPGYQFRLNQGRSALENAASARGTLNSGGTLADVMQFGQGLASQEYGNVWDRAFNAWGQNYRNALDTYGTNRGNALENYQTNATTGLNAYNANRGNAFENYSLNAATGLNSYNTNRANASDIYNTNTANGLNAYNTNRGNAADNYATNLGAGLNAYNTNRGNAYDNYSLNATVDQTRYQDQSARAKELYDQAWARYLNDQDVWYKNQSNPFGKLTTLGSLGA